jgi:Tfp pilus assembly protein PilF
MRLSTYLILVVLIVAGCGTVGRPPGHVVASENHFENGVKHFEKGQIKQAIHQFEKAIEKNPANFRAHYYLGLCHKRQGAGEKAHKHFQKAIELNANDEAWVMKVKAEMGTAGPGKAKKK